jgi:hypothetical protein
MLLMARHAGVVGLLLGLKPVAAARGVAGYTVELPALGAGAHPPGGVGVVFTQIAAVGIEVRILQGGEIEVVKVAISRREGGAVTGYTFAWQMEQASFFCSGVNPFQLRILMSSGSCPLGA